MNVLQLTMLALTFAMAIAFPLITIGFGIATAGTLYRFIRDISAEIRRRGGP